MWNCRESASGWLSSVQEICLGETGRVWGGALGCHHQPPPPSSSHQQRKRRRGEESRGSHAHASISIHGHVSAFSKQAKQYQSIRVVIHCVDLAFISICQIDHPILWLQPSVFSIWPKWSANGHDGHYQTGWTHLDRRYDVTRCIAGEGGWPTQSDRLSLPLSGNGNESQGAPNSHLILYCLEPAILHIQYASTPDCSHNSKTSKSVDSLSKCCCCRRSSCGHCLRPSLRSELTEAKNVKVCSSPLLLFSWGLWHPGPFSRAVPTDSLTIFGNSTKLDGGGYLTRWVGGGESEEWCGQREKTTAVINDTPQGRGQDTSWDERQEVDE